MAKPFWHRLSLKQQQAVIQHRDPDRPRLLGLPEGWTYAEFLDMYRQPNWCEYPRALMGDMGCWSLLSSNTKMISRRSDCANCDCCKQNYKSSARSVH